MGKSITKQHISQEMIVKIAAEAAVHAAMNYVQAEKQKEAKSRYNRRLHNTKLLLKHYLLLKEHCREAVFDLPKAAVAEKAIDILDALDRCDSEIYIDSIRKSVTRTYIILVHIDQMMRLYKIYCQTSGIEEDERRFRVVQAVYFERRKVDDVAEQESIDKRTCYRDINDACEKLSSLIFGIDGLSAVSQTCH